MADVVVVGAGICGSAAAMMLARDGHSVTVLDRDPGPIPASVDDAWNEWSRRSVGQFRLAHIMLSRGTSILKSALPEVTALLAAEGGLKMNAIDAFIEASGQGGREPADDRFDMLTGRRTTIEWVLATVMDNEPNVTVRRGVVASGLLTGAEVAAGTPHVAGVHLDSGEELAADLVIDATGRNSPTPRWLEAIGARAPIEHSEDSGFAYYGRFFQSDDGSVPKLVAPVLTPLGTMSILTIPSDNGTWATMLYASSKDKPLRRFKDPEVFERVVRSSPQHAHWLDGTPISDMATMVGVSDRTRTFVIDGEPVVTGMLTIADAAACTNPSVGRGMSLGLIHTEVMRDTVRSHLDDPLALATEFARRTATDVDTWHHATRTLDRARVAEMQALADGIDLPADPTTGIGNALARGAGVDLTIARAMGEIQGCLAHADEVLARPGLFEHLLSLDLGDPQGISTGPTRAQLLDLVS